MKGFVYILLFVISYSPLLFYLWIIGLDFPKEENLSIKSYIYELFINYNLTFLIISLVGILFFMILLNIFKKVGNITLNIKTIEGKNIEYSSYIMTYFFAFLGLKFDSLQNLIGTIVLFSLLAFLYSKSNLIYTNPVFSLFGYNIYEINGKHKVISKTKDIKGANIGLVKLCEGIYFYKNN